MARPFSDDLRIRIVQAVEGGQSQVSVAGLFGVGLRTVQRYLGRWRENGQFARGKFGGHKKPVLLAHQALVEGLVRERPDMTLEEMKAALSDAQGIRISIGALHNFLKKLGLSYKKNGSRGRAGPARRPGGAGRMAGKAQKH